MSSHSPDSESVAATTAQQYPSAQLANVVAAVRELKHPTEIGPYRILSLIGEGGMGTVYKAEQREPIQRIVAIKIVKLGMDTREVIARFESERQALAMMSHANVARVFEAGATEGGRPYFVMEYVAGEPITTFADRQRLTVPQRLELFTQACDAVQHAHQRAIIHRDLKPSNILVTMENDKPTVKVIDFGVAKAISERLTEKTFFTETGQLVGTPEYMSPEQAQVGSAAVVDTRSDVYSLGVVLYELLAGSLPFDPRTLRSAGYHEIQRIIREVDPPRPSTRLSRLGRGAEAIAQLRQTRLEALEKQLKRELEWIPLRAMRKDPRDRYATATELAEDVRNYLQDKPLRAGPESAMYRARKFLRRHKTGVAASAVMLLLLIAGIVTTTWQAVRATRAERQARAEKRQADFQRARAERAAEDLKEVNRFLTDDLLFAASPEIARGREMTVREAVDRAADVIQQRFRARPLTEAAVRRVLADTYHTLGLSERGLPHARAALDIYLRERGPDDEQAIVARCEVGRILALLRRHDEAEPMLRDALARARRQLGENHPTSILCLATLAMSIRMQERFDEAEPLLREVLERDRAVHGPRSADAATALNNLAVLLNTLGRADEAEPLYRESLQIKRELMGEDHPSYLSTLSNLARVLQTQRKIDEAIVLSQRVLAEKRRILGDDHPDTTLTMNNLASLYLMAGEPAKSELLHREALSRRTRAAGEDDADTLQSMHNLANTLRRAGKREEAESLFPRVIEKRRRVLGPQHPHTLNSMLGLAGVYEDEQRFAEAERLLAELSREQMLSVLPAEGQALIAARYGICLARLGKHAAAEPVLLDARQRLRTTGQQQSEPMRQVLTGLAQTYEKTGRDADAARFRDELAQLPPSTQPATAPAD